MKTVSAILLVACACLASGAAFAAEQTELPSRREVRSLAAEAAGVFRLDAEGRSTALYTRKMADNARKRLGDIDASAGDRDPVLHRAIAEAIAALDKRAATALRNVSERLFALAGPHGPAD